MNATIGIAFWHKIYVMLLFIMTGMIILLLRGLDVFTTYNLFILK